MSLAPIATALIEQLWPYLLAGLMAVAGAWAAYAKGKASQKARQAAADAAARTEAQKIDDAVAGRAADENRERLGRWTKS
jgi:Flp pilus assembly protein TadG